MSCTAALVAGAACLPAAAVRRPRASSSSSGAPRQQRLRVLAGAGFGSSKQQKGGSSGGSAKQKQPKLARYLETETVAPGGSSSASADDGWVEMPGVEADKTFISKPIKPLILATGRAVCLYKFDDQVFASDANSTAYKYPLADATILRVKGKPAVEVPLDGTVYDLATGKVLSWCPKNSLVRKVLGGLKDKTEPVDLPVYPVEVRGNKVFVKFVKE